MKKLLHSVVNNLNKVAVLFGGRTVSLLIIALIIAMITIYLSDKWLQSIQKISEQLATVNYAISGVTHLEANLLKAESAQRGFLLTSSEEYVKPYDQAMSDARASLKNLREIIDGLNQASRISVQKNLLDEITTSIEAKATEMKLTIQFAKEGKFKDAKNLIHLDSGLLEMEKISSNKKQLLSSLAQQKKQLLAKLDQTRKIARISLITMPLVLILLVVLVIRQLLKDIAEKALLQQKLQQENLKYAQQAKEQSQLLTSLSLGYQADVERERHKLSREIHDELGSILTATKMDISWVIKTLHGAYPEVADKLKKTNGYLDQGINFKRQIVQELHPAMITSFGFWPALRTLIEDAVERNEWALTLVLPDDDTKINETIGLVAYRIVQETLNNANKYAKATAININMISDDQHLKIEIQDNGIGLDLNEIDPTTHGLRGMRNRVQAIGGLFELDSSPGNGVFTRVILPLDIQSLAT